MQQRLGKIEKIIIDKISAVFQKMLSKNAFKKCFLNFSPKNQKFVSEVGLCFCKMCNNTTPMSLHRSTGRE